jgi:hypothetical protein
MAFQSRRGQKLKKTNHQMFKKANSQTPTKFLVCSYNILNCLEWIKNKKVMRFENRRGPKKKKKKNLFCKLESLFIFLLFFHYSFSFALQRWFFKLNVTFP